ncbi:nuclear transport factor 2 family protein [Mesorhizobium sp. M3A.F.Ca.ET.080.04.2.1]|uniref:nuclear transport factor 2 family protein n=1 Tax=Mesorhizobium sp. M3A.F.Ca.ET.080.04.2.1 TaxID=2493676 RepID=UPI000F76385D|nr:nuclear transport factor 2 family protein [Mesorhizobium sp. M3A.F.Ca.ET.080.04.2.1]AZO07991.1 nuclear transport factor 2 family protein [Mesorhizobium sp. M3A.F.Ca.ET.080.04.2.1]RWF21465.1 MAG: nuclear transport factor 2 family protein [Mesorhizobium sp.]
MEPEKVFRSQMAALLANDTDAIVAHFTPDCRLFDMARPMQPFVGREGLRTFLVAYFKTWRVAGLTITNLVTQGSRLAAEIELSLEARDSSGSRLIRSSLFDDIEGGLIARERAYRDPAGRKE